MLPYCISYKPSKPPAVFPIRSSCKLDVRTRGLTVFFDIIKTYGAQFKPLWWRETFTVIFRVFHHFRSPSMSRGMDGIGESGLGLSSMERTEWMNTTCNHTLFSIVDVFSQFYEPLHSILLGTFFLCVCTLSKLILRTSLFISFPRLHMSE